MMPRRDEIKALTAVYRADGGWIGELRYAAGRIMGTTHCSLCAITHGALGKKSAFQRCEAGLPVPVRLVHRNEQPREVAEHTAGHIPCVVAHTDAGLRTLLGPEELDLLHGDVDAFEQALRRASERLGLRMPDGA